MSNVDPRQALEAEIRAHDRQLVARGLRLWVGSEPTFTDRFSHEPQWVHAALGGDKEMRARSLLRALAARWPRCLVLRSVGRRYPGEDEPRWNLGLYRRRDDEVIWRGPPDPLLVDEREHAPTPIARWAAAQAATLAQGGWRVESVIEGEDGAWRLLCAPRTAADTASGELLLQAATVGGSARIDLPPLDAVADFLALVGAVEQAALACALPALQIGGAPPPVDASVESTTVTPDPAVIEINTAPSVDAYEFLLRSEVIYAAAAEQGLAPFRLHYNGAVADSGGGGQLTLGGPSPQASAFIERPLVLPRLVRYVIRHPALSYLYSHDHVGSSGQSARADECDPTDFDELALALHLLDRQPQSVAPELVWRSLAPFLCDATGNSHRAEINVEKLWNAALPGRGMQGLVEFRALRMQHNPERAAALVCLLRAVVAMLCDSDDHLPLMEWGRVLHERFALPFYLEQDLEAVLAQLSAAGLGLGPALLAVLRRDRFRQWAAVDLPGAVLEVRRGVDFWPLLGDAGSPEQHGTSRLVDASTTRLEFRLRPRAGDGLDGLAWQLSAAGVQLPWRVEEDSQGELRVFGLRYRNFVPAHGLHPALGAQAPVNLWLEHPQRETAWVVSLHEWRTDGRAYAGLPADLDDAQQRRAERVQVAQAARRPASETRLALPSRALGEYCLDMRFLT